MGAPKEMSGRVHYATATKQVAHGDPCVEDSIAGVAIKQQTPNIDDGSPARKNVMVGEDFAILCHGVVEVPELAGAAVGDLLHITVSNNVLTESSGGGTERYGKVVAIEGERGTPTGFMRVDLDLKTAD